MEAEWGDLAGAGSDYMAKKKSGLFQHKNIVLPMQCSAEGRLRCVQLDQDILLTSICRIKAEPWKLSPSLICWHCSLEMEGLARSKCRGCRRARWGIGRKGCRRCCKRGWA